MVADTKPLPGLSPPAEYAVRIRGRLYPASLRVTTHEPVETPAAPIPPSLEDRVAATLWRMLPWSKRLAEDFVSPQELVESYEASLAVLRGRHAEVEALLRGACALGVEAGLEVDPDDADRPKKHSGPHRRLVNRRYRQGRYGALDVDGVLTAELLTHPTEEIYERLNKSLCDAAGGLARGFAGALDRYVERSVFGVLDWAGEGVCKFHFFLERRVEKERLQHVETE